MTNKIWFDFDLICLRFLFLLSSPPTATLSLGWCVVTAVWFVFQTQRWQRGNWCRVGLSWPVLPQSQSCLAPSVSLDSVSSQVSFLQFLGLPPYIYRGKFALISHQCIKQKHMPKEGQPVIKSKGSNTFPNLHWECLHGVFNKDMKIYNCLLLV